MTTDEVNSLLRKYGFEVRGYVGRFVKENKTYWSHTGSWTGPDGFVTYIREGDKEGKNYYSVETLEKKLMKINKI